MAVKISVVEKRPLFLNASSVATTTSLILRTGGPFFIDPLLLSVRIPYCF